MSHSAALVISPTERADADSIWAILEPVIRAGETWALDPDMTRDAALDYWFAPAHAPFVAVEGDAVRGAYYLRANQAGPGSHVANAGYMVATDSTGRGVARAMCAHSLDEARARGFRAMQFNLVVSTNAPAVHLWRAMGFREIGRVPAGFRHPGLGLVDALILYREL